jgi:hypothetical protein
MHKTFQFLIVQPGLNILHPLIQMDAFFRDIPARQAADHEADRAVADLYRTTGGADIAGDAAEGFFGAAFVIAALGQGDVLHDVDALGAALRTGVAMNAVVDFRVKLPYDVAGQGQIVDNKRLGTVLRLAQVKQDERENEGKRERSKKSPSRKAQVRIQE